MRPKPPASRATRRARERMGSDAWLCPEQKVILETDADLQQLIVSNPSRTELDAYLNEHDVRSLVDDGMSRALAEQTTIEEVLRVVNS